VKRSALRRGALIIALLTEEQLAELAEPTLKLLAEIGQEW
jgi:hypothetical protein